MPEVSALTLVLAGAAASLPLLLLLLRRRRRRRGGKRARSVGRYPLIGSHRHLPEPWFRSLYEKFGSEPVVLLHQGTQPVYVLNKWQPFKEAMLDNAEQLAGRFSQLMTSKLFGDVGGLVASDGEVWREYRRFTLKALRDLGFGRRAGEELVSAEAEHLCRAIDAAEGAAIDTSSLMSTATSNVICQLVFGSRLASEDPHFAEILDLFSSFTQSEDNNTNNSVFMSMDPVVAKLPWLAPLLTATEGAKKVVNDFVKLMDYCTAHRDRHAAEIANVDRARDYIESHLLHQRSGGSVFNKMRLTMAVSDLFLAGTDTTANTMRWAMLFMIENPQVADAVHREIVDAIGRERSLTLADKSSLNYTLATIEEVLRRSSLVALGIPHRVTGRVTACGYEFLPDDLVTFNVYAIQHDPELFPEPMRFRPERHLKDGRFVACENLATFGLGKRACLGESLARVELFMFFSTIMQRYRPQLDPEDTRSLFDLTDHPDLYKGCFIRAPPKHKIVFERR